MQLVEKKLSDFDLSHIIYLSVGTHMGESLEKIMKRKSDEMIDFGLFAFYSGISQTVETLCSKFCMNEEPLYCVMVASGKDTTTQGERRATFYKGVDGEIKKIPEGMKVTFTKNGSYALMVEAYYKIVGDNVLYIKEYDYEDQKKYIRGFGFLNKVERDVSSLKMNDRLPKEVLYIAKLKKPYIVRISDKKDF